MNRAVTFALVVAVLGVAGIARAEAIKLPPPKTAGGMSLLEALKLRQSQRAFSPQPLSEQTLSTLLWAACGVNRTDSGKRTAPTAVNWQEIDVYVAKADGLFRYDAKAHALQPVLSEDIRARAGKQDFMKTAPAVLIYVSDCAKITGPAKEQQDFFSATDTGFVSQNVYLCCAAEGLATVVVAWVDKPALAAAMKLRPEQKVILCQPVGYPPSAPPPAATAPRLKDGAYQAASKGYMDDIKVEVRVEGGKIAGVKVLQHKESAPRDATTEIPARIVKAQKTEVDAVTGATISSKAIMRAAQEALSKARE